MVHRKMSLTAAGTTAEELYSAGLMTWGSECRIHPSATFVAEDVAGTLRSIVLGDRVTIGAFAIINGGTVLGSDARIGHHVIVGEPEFGYAVRRIYPGHGATTEIGSAVVLRAGATVYAATRIGDRTTIGHNALLRTGSQVGADSQLAANLTVERDVRIGSQVRCSPNSHLTASTVIEDHVFIGAGVRTVNDKEMIWRDDEHQQPLRPPHLRRGCRVGSGAVLLAGIQIGRRALVGAGSVVTRDVDDFAVVYGVPAVQHGQVA